MNLLGSAFYDPTGAAAVSKATTALLAMTALDTTNLRVTFTAPLSGKVKVVMSGGALHGAATYPFILLGVLQSTTVIARVAPNVTVCGAAAATTPASLYAEFVVSVTPGAALTWDMAYGVEGLVAATGLKYGGPNNNTTAGDAFGGISFSVWDASPVYLPAAMPTSSVHVKLDTIDDFLDTEMPAVTSSLAALTTAVGVVDDFLDTEIADIRARLPAALVSGRMDVSVGAMAAGVITAAAHTAGAIDAAALAADAGTEIATAVWASGTRVLTAGTNIALAKGTGVTGFNDLSAAQVNAEVDTGIADAALATSASLSTAVGYIDTEVAAIKVVTDKLDTALELDGAVWRYTVNALEQGPAGSGGGGLDAAGVRAAVGLASANLDTQLSGISSKTTNLPASPADQTVIAAAFGTVNTTLGTLATGTDLAVVDTLVDGIKAKTDQLAFTVANKLDANAKAVNDITVTGAGTAEDPWGP